MIRGDVPLTLIPLRLSLLLDFSNTFFSLVASSTSFEIYIFSGFTAAVFGDFTFSDFLESLARILIAAESLLLFWFPVTTILTD